MTTPTKTPPSAHSVLSQPVWVPPKVLHRPTYHAPGCKIVEKLTGRELAQTDDARKEE